MKIRIKLISILSAALFILFSSCSRHLEVEPISSISASSFWKTESDAEGALAGMYVQLRTEAQLNLFIFGEGRSETMEWGRLQGTLDYDRYYLNLLTPGTAGPSWQGLYSIVNSANLLLKYIPQITYRSEATKKNALAQAYTMRAFCYFVMARTWGDLPLRTEPIEGNDVNSIQKERSPVADVFQLIKKDLDDAISLFSSTTIPAGRNTWSKPACYALMADVYLWTGKRLNGGQADFTTALDACVQVEAADVMLLNNYADVFSYTTKGNKEILMASRFLHLESPSNNYFENMYMAAGLIPANITQGTKDKIGLAGGLHVWTVSEIVRNQYSDDDQRKNGTFFNINTPGVGGNPDQYYATLVMKGRGVVVNGVRFFMDDIILYRFADVILMKAEAKNALQQDPSAEINRVRARAYGANYAQHVFVPGTQADNDEAILQERLLELAVEGKRWWDLVRFGKAFDLVPSLQDRAGQNHLLLFPISNAVLGLESKISQNPGYN